MNCDKIIKLCTKLNALQFQEHVLYVLVGSGKIKDETDVENIYKEIKDVEKEKVKVEKLIKNEV